MTPEHIIFFVSIQPGHVSCSSSSFCFFLSVLFYAGNFGNHVFRSCLNSSTCSTVIKEAASHADDAPDDAVAERDAERGGEVAIEQAQSSGSQSPTAELLVGIKHTGMLLLMEETNYAR